MNYYYLKDNRIWMSNEKMPTEDSNDYRYTLESQLEVWKDELQPCEISASELLKLNEHLYYSNKDKQGYKFKEWLKSNPIDVTDIVEERLIDYAVDDDTNSSFKNAIYFKKPLDSNGVITFKPKQVEEIEAEIAFKQLEDDIWMQECIILTFEDKLKEMKATLEKLKERKKSIELYNQK